MRSLDELVGRSDLLEVDNSVLHYKNQGLDLSPLLAPAHQLNPGASIRKSIEQDHELDAALDNYLIAQVHEVALLLRIE